MASSELQKRKLEEYEMQLFSFHSRTVYATLRKIVSARIQSTIETLCETIEKKYKLNSENLAVLKENQKHLEKAYCKGALPHLQNIENVVNKFIAVPSNVLLDEDKYQRMQYSESEFNDMQKRLEDLQQRAKRATILNTVLKEELQILEEFPVSEANINEMCNTIENALNSTDINDKLYRLMNDYKHISKWLFGATSITTKMKYNTVDNIECKELDLNNI